jgi:hypothetical protein
MNAPIGARAAHKLRYRPGYMAALVLQNLDMKISWKTHEKLGENNGTTMGKKTSMENPLKTPWKVTPPKPKGWKR